jgi:spermidine/putrescine transport system substrate-binding protein
MPTPSPPAQELTLYNWSGYLPQSILDAFRAEYGIKVTYLIYETQEQAIENIKAGQVYDVVVMGSHLVPGLVANNLLAEIDYRNVPNFKNVSANFRDLAYDPGNKHSVLFEWGTSGIIVRQDLVDQPITSWTDLWDSRYAGKIGLWPLPRSTIGLTLKSLGYSFNSEEPEELQAAEARLLDLKPNVFMLDPNLPTAASFVVSGQAVMIYGWSYDASEARKQNQAVAFVLPEEGVLLWGDNFTIPANSPHKHTAELFINFMLRPEISAQLVNETFIATSNEVAESFIKPEILYNPIVYPTVEMIKSAEWILPLSPAGQKRYDQIWQGFMAEAK